MAAAGPGRGRLRASHADREQVIGMLKGAFVQGRLTKDELDTRLGQTLTARTYADLAALTADLPAWRAGAQLAREPARVHARPSAHELVIWTAGASIPPAIMAMLAGISAGSGGLFFTAFLVLFTAVIAGGTAALDLREQRRSGRGQPPRPGGVTAAG